MRSTIGNKTRHIYLVAILVAMALVLYGVKMLDRLHQAQSSWQSVVTDTGHTVHGLHTLQARFGYGGFIDKYRRYQLQPDAHLLPAMEADLREIGQALRHLDHPHLNAEGRRAIEVLQGAVAAYSHNIAVMQARTGMVGADRVASVDDAQAVWAIGVLSGHAMHEGDAHLTQANAALADVKDLVYVGFMLLVPIFLVTVLLAHQGRRLADANMAASQATEYLQILLEATPDALLIVNSQGQVRDVNQAAIQLFGYRRDEFGAMAVEDLMPPRFRQGHDALRQQAFDKRCQRMFDAETAFFILGKAQNEIPVDISLSYADVNGERLALLALRDISERKQLEHLLRERQDALEMAQSIAHIGIWVWDVQPDQLGWSDETYRIFGLEPGVYAPSYGAFMDRVHPDDRVRVGTAVAQTLEDDTPYHVEHRVVRPDGVERFVVEKGRLTRDEDGHPLRMVGTVWDITERKQAERALLFDRAIIDGISQPVVVVDQRGCIEEVNPAYCEMSGYTSDEVVGRPSNVLKSGRHDKVYYQGLWESLAKDRKWQGELWIRRKDGAIVPRLLSITTICEPELKQCRYVGFYSDITSLKESEAKLEKLAHFDPLTGLANRMLFHDRLRAAMSRAHRSSSQVAVVFVDLDGFKQVNDALGHRTGDLLLVEVSERMKVCVREDDTVARLGGDEFVLVLNELDSVAEVAELARRLQGQLQITLGSGVETLKVSASMGIALYPQHGETVSLLLEKADLAMYQAKQAGKNAFVFYDADAPDGDGQATP